jgi:HEAT repeat protein
MKKINNVKWFIVIPLCLYFIGCQTPQTPGFEPIEGKNLAIIQSQALQIIGSSLSDADPLVRTNAIEVVARTKNLSFMNRVQPMLRDENVPVRFAAVLAVGDLKYTPARATLGTLLKDTDTSVILAAAYAMSKLGEPAYIEALKAGLTNDNQVVRANAALLLGKAGDKNSLNSLRQVMQDTGSSDFVTFQAVESIAMLNDTTIYPKLWSMLISAFADIKVMGIRAMGALGTKQAEDAIGTMLADQILEVRLVAAEQLGKLGNKAGESVVRDVFAKKLTAGLDKQSTERVYVLTALAIGQINIKTVTGFLPQLMKNESKFVRLAAAGAFLQCISR